jgi:hypothetical protein
MGLDLPVDEIREHARRSALAGREIWTNPHLGDDAVQWAEAWREVPEALRGTEPELAESFRTIHARARKVATAPAMKARVHRAITRGRSTLTASEITQRIAYHERILAESVSAERRGRAECQLAKLRKTVPCGC